MQHLSFRPLDLVGDAQTEGRQHRVDLVDLVFFVHSRCSLTVECIQTVEYLEDSDPVVLAMIIVIYIVVLVVAFQVVVTSCVHSVSCAPLL